MEVSSGLFENSTQSNELQFGALRQVEDSDLVMGSTAEVVSTVFVGRRVASSCPGRVDDSGAEIPVPSRTARRGCNQNFLKDPEGDYLAVRPVCPVSRP